MEDRLPGFEVEEDLELRQEHQEEEQECKCLIYRKSVEMPRKLTRGALETRNVCLTSKGAWVNSRDYYERATPNERERLCGRESFQYREIRQGGVTARKETDNERWRGGQRSRLCSHLLKLGRKCKKF